jgi:hypothetical protein
MEQTQIEDIMKDDVNLVKVGADVYALTKINCSITQAVDHVRTHYKERLTQVVQNLQADAFGKADALADREFNKITTQLNRNTVQIPRDKEGTLVTAIGRELCPVRCVQFFITAIRGRSTCFNSEHGALCSKFPELRAKWDEVNSTGLRHDLCVTFQATPVATICYAKMSGQMIVNRRVYHAFDTRIGTQWWQLCTGNATPEQFWNAPGFADSLRIINLDSPATRSMRFDVPNREFSTSDLIRHFDCTYAFTQVDATGQGEGWATGGGR